MCLLAISISLFVNYLFMYLSIFFTPVFGYFYSFICTLYLNLHSFTLLWIKDFHTSLNELHIIFTACHILFNFIATVYYYLLYFFNAWAF